MLRWFRNHVAHQSLLALALLFGLSAPVHAGPTLFAPPVVVQPTESNDHSAPAIVIAEGSQAQNEHHLSCLRACSEKQGDAIFLVYNFEVEGTHTYFVGGSVNTTGPPAGWVWVHNTCKIADLIQKTLKDAEEAVGLGLSEKQKIEVMEEIVEQTAGKNVANVANNAELLFKRSPNWKAATYNGKNVYKNDSLFDVAKTSSWTKSGKVKTGTNVERMKDGLAPVGRDGKPVDLHHITQEQTGPLVEIAGGKHDEFYKMLHDNWGQEKSKIVRKGASGFDKEREAYWKARGNGL